MNWIENKRIDSGKISEKLACEYLLQQGLLFQTCNFYHRAGELDLIMTDKNTLVFVEVKYRKNTHYGGAISSITTQKQYKIKKCASYYMQQCGLNEYNTSCRFDVVTIEGNISSPQITWLKNAF